MDARLHEAESELSAARRLLHEAGAERELLRVRLEEARQETEDLLRGVPQQARCDFLALSMMQKVRQQ